MVHNRLVTYLSHSLSRLSLPQRDHHKCSCTQLDHPHKTTYNRAAGILSRRTRLRQVSMVLLVLLMVIQFHSSSPTHAAGQVSFVENFESLPVGNWAEGSVHGQWRQVFNGYGSAGINIDGSHTLFEQPRKSTQPAETHSSLTVSLMSFSDIDLSLRVKTVTQLRTPQPNPWEVAWIMWHYTDNTHFYYFTLKPNGWELGKEDPAYPQAQRFLATGSSPTFPVGAWYSVRITQQRNIINVWANNMQLASFTDTERAYSSGVIGLYNEDAFVQFDAIKATGRSK